MKNLLAVLAVLTVFGDGGAQPQVTLEIVNARADYVAGEPLEMICEVANLQAGDSVIFTWVLDGSHVKQTPTPLDGTVTSVDSYERGRITSRDTGKYECDVTVISLASTMTYPSNKEVVFVKNIAFTAYFAERDGNIMKFQNTRTNVGEVYDTNTGKFKAPLGGNYYFEVNLHVRCSTPDTEAAFLKHAGQIITWIRCPGNVDRYYPTSNSVILRVEKNEEVFIEYSDGGLLSSKHTHNSFSGYLIDF